MEGDLSPLSSVQEQVADYADELYNPEYAVYHFFKE
jgi:hypothetical protein